MINYINNPFDMVIQAVNNLYPSTKANIQFNPTIRHFKIFGLSFGHCGETIFPDDGSIPLINISTNIPFKHMPEILAHELAHVIAGVEHEHDEKWQEIFSNIQAEFTRIVMEKFKECEY